MTAVESDPPQDKDYQVSGGEHGKKLHEAYLRTITSEDMLREMDDVLALSIKRWLWKDRSESSWLRHVHRRLAG